MYLPSCMKNEQKSNITYFWTVWTQQHSSPFSTATGKQVMQVSTTSCFRELMVIRIKQPNGESEFIFKRPKETLSPAVSEGIHFTGCWDTLNNHDSLFILLIAHSFNHVICKDIIAKQICAILMLETHTQEIRNEKQALYYYPWH